MISFVIPAHNEEALLGRTLDSVRTAAEALGQPWEVVVADDASDDATAEVARAHGARVAPLQRRQIAASRNGGARAAEGDVLIFLDADTILPPETLRGAWKALCRGAVGGGAPVAMDEPVGLVGAGAVAVWNALSRIFRWAAGSFIFVRREIFEAVGGFDERYFATEEIWLSLALHRHGRFVILPDPVITSARKLQNHRISEFVWVGLRAVLTGGAALMRREGLEVWYGPRKTG